MQVVSPFSDDGHSDRILDMGGNQKQGGNNSNLKQALPKK